MGTKFRTLLAPVGLPTGDGRRFGAGALSLADVPFPFEWARSREGGHDGAVGIGVVQEAHLGTVNEAVANGWISAEATASMSGDTVGIWATGELHDSVDREKMPRLAEDVAEAMHLMSAGTLGPSVDLDSFEGVPVMAGSNEPLTEAMFEEHFSRTGQEPKLELLITSGRVRAATLVSIPAFAETSRPLELITNEQPTEPLVLLASVGTPTRRAAVDFDGVALTGPTPITYDHDTGRVFGHIATWRTCHVGYSEVCVTAPKSPDGYAAFNRFPVETADGTVWAGRITVGGRHAALSATAAGAIAEYDSKTVAAHVRAYEDEFGIAIAGVIEPDLDEGTLAVLSRRKVSGDWRETAAGLSLVEVLALSPGPRAHAEPGFPVETFSRAGRQVALVASLSPDVETATFVEPVDVASLAAQVADEMNRRSAREVAASSLAELVKVETERERAALVAAMTGEV